MSNQRYDLSERIQSKSVELYNPNDYSQSQEMNPEVFNDKGFQFSREVIASLTPEDQILFQQFGSGNIVQRPYQAVHHAFEKQAEMYPFAIAAMHLNEQITYSRLNTQANRLARLLEQEGVVRGDNVGLFLQRSIPMLVGIIGSLKAGAAYVPQDARVVPKPQLEHIVNVADIKVILTLSHLKDSVPIPKGCVCICIDDLINESIDESASFVTMTQIHRDESQLYEPKSVAQADDNCFILFTSGTTGKPNGVQVSHKNVCNILHTEPGSLGMRPGLKVGQILNIGFDMAAWEILGCLSHGATLVIRSKDIAETVEKVDIVISTPTILSNVDASKCQQVKVAAVAGEPCPRALADTWSSFCTFYNSCGPTETTIVNTMQPHDVNAELLSIGKPTPNNTVYILNENLEPCAIGEVGEMWAGGDCVTSGYLANDKLNQERYKVDPFLGNGRKMFNTRDLGRWTTEGELEHLGRSDDQVKIRGFRVELDSVSTSLEAVENCKRAVTLKLDSRNLVGFVSPETVDTDIAKAQVAKDLPYYCTPLFVLALEDLPMTSRGKVDKRALLELAKTYQAKHDIPEDDGNNPPKSGGTPVGVTASQDSDVVNYVSNTVFNTNAVPVNALAPKENTNGYSNGQSNGNGHSKALSTGLASDIVLINRLSQAEPIPTVEAESPKSATSVTDVSQYIDVVDQDAQTEAIVLESKETKKPKLSFINDDFELPKPQPFYLRFWKHHTRSQYRRLVVLVSFINIALLAYGLTAGQWWTSDGVALATLSNIVVGNIALAILIRQQYVINLLFKIATSVPTSWPLSIRWTMGKVFHFGGLHMGGALGGTVWFAIFIGSLMFHSFKGILGVSLTTILLTVFILQLLVAMIIFALPSIRAKYHNNFELVHRFAGWTVLALFWLQTVSFIIDQRGTQGFLSALVSTPAFWVLSIATFSIVLPWLRLKRVPVEIENPSSHVALVKFDYGVTPFAGSSTTISRNPLREWHSFANVPSPDKEGFRLTISRAGDWTGRLIDDLPSHVWVKGIPTAGVGNVDKLFKRVVWVCTGSGIGPSLPHLLSQEVPARLIWSTRNPVKTYGQDLIDEILDVEPDALIWNTDELGRPDLVNLAYQAVEDFEAEAVIVIANQKLTRQVVYGMEIRGIPAYGAIWDS